MTMTISLKKVDLALARKIKMTAAGQGVTLKQFILGAVERALPADIDERVAAVERAGRRSRGGRK
jgi:hypothetical protein